MLASAAQLQAAVGAVLADVTAMEIRLDANKTTMEWMSSEIERLKRALAEATKPPEPAPRKTVTLNTDSLKERLASGESDVTYLLVVPQTIDAKAAIRGDNVVVKSGQTVKAPVKIVAPPGVYNGLYVHGKNFLAENLHLHTDFTQRTTNRKDCPAVGFAFQPGSSGEVRTCTARHLDTFVHLENGHLGVKVRGCDAMGRGYGVWLDGRNVEITDCRLQSLIEHPIRMDAGTATTATTDGVVIRDCQLVREANDTKECLSLRQGRNVLVEDVLCQIGVAGQPVGTGYGVRLGREPEQNSVAPLEDITFRRVRLVNGWLHVKDHKPTRRVRFEDVSFSGDLHVKPPLQVNGGREIVVKNVTWDGAGPAWKLGPNAELTVET